MRAVPYQNQITVLVKYHQDVFSIGAFRNNLHITNSQRRASPSKLKIRNPSKPPKIKPITAEIPAPARKLFSKVPLLLAILKPIRGHRKSEHMNPTKASNSDDANPIVANMKIGLMGATKPSQ